MEASMHGPFDKSPVGQSNIYQNWSMKLVLALPLLIVIALVGFVISHPGAVKWVADGVQAEFVGTDSLSGPAPSKRVAQPTNQARNVSAH
jgi:hypothetical protein